MTRRRIALAAAVFGLCLLVPVFVDQDYQLKVLFRVFMFATLGLAWNLVGGYAGQLSLGHSAYFGIGAYSLALFPQKLGLPIPIALALGMIVAMAAAFVIGRVSFRLRGPYFALATIAFSEILRYAAKNLHSVTGGDVGVQPPALFTQDPSRWFYESSVVLAALALAITAWIARARFGYQLQAIREDEDTALACGIDASWTKLSALLISAAITSVAGAVWASQFLFVDPDSVLSTRLSEQIAIVAMLGGAGTLTGPIVGAAILVPAEEMFKNAFAEAHLLIYGTLIVVVVLFVPNGIVGSAAGWWRARRSRAP